MPRKKRVVQTSTPVKPNKKAAALGPLLTPDQLQELFADLPDIELLARRLQNPNLPGSLPILLADEDANSCTNSEHMNRLKPGAATCHLCGKPARRWYLRWFNLGKENRSAEMRALRYRPVEVVELVDASDIADLYRSKDDRHVRRGDRGQEVLAKMPLVAYNAIKAAQRVAWNASAASPLKVKDAIANAAGAEFGDEAGQDIHDGGIRMESMSRKTTTLGEEAGIEADA